MENLNKKMMIGVLSVIALTAPLVANADGALEHDNYMVRAVEGDVGDEKIGIRGFIGDPSTPTNPDDQSEIRHGRAHVNGSFKLVGEGWANTPAESYVGGFTVFKNGEEIYSYTNSIHYNSDPNAGIYAFPWYDEEWIMDGENEYIVEFLRGGVSWTIYVNEFIENWRTDDGVQKPYVDTNPGFFELNIDGTWTQTPAA